MSGSSTLRLFVGVYPPAAAASAMSMALDGLTLAPHRRLPIEHIHLTVHFIGDRSKRELDGVIGTIEKATGGIESFELTASELITLPSRGMPRLVAATTDLPPGLAELQRRLASRLSRFPRSKPGDRYLPHLTLCRFKRGARPGRINATPLAHPSFVVHEIKLMRSVLQPTGAEHIEVASMPLIRRR